MTGAPPLYRRCSGRGVKVEIEALRLLAEGTPNRGVNSLAAPAITPAKPEGFTGAAIDRRLLQPDRADVAFFSVLPWVYDPAVSSALVPWSRSSSSVSSSLSPLRSASSSSVRP